MKRCKEKGFVFQTNEDSNFNHEFANELGAEIMQEKMNRKEDYLSKISKKESVKEEVAEEIIPLHQNNSTYDDVQVFNNQNFYNRKEEAEDELTLKDRKKSRGCNG